MAHRFRRRILIPILLLAAALLVLDQSHIRWLGLGPIVLPTPGRVAALNDDMKTITQAALAGAPTRGVGAERLRWPTPEYYEITSPFGMRLHPVLHVPKLHAGIDIGAPNGAMIIASAAGTVVLVERLPVYGQTVVVHHGSGIATVYAHLSEVVVKEGQQVSEGSQLGLVGATGQVSGPHLHYEVRREGKAINPLDLIGKA